MTPDQLAKSNSEHAQQTALFAWANMVVMYGYTAAGYDKSYTIKGHAQKLLDIHNDTDPRLKWLHAIHNQGHGDAIRGSFAKAEGVKAGVWDIFLPVIVHDEYSGLYIEMKVGKNKLTDKQKEFQTFAISQGYKCDDVCYTWREALHSIINYLGFE